MQNRVKTYQPFNTNTRIISNNEYAHNQIPTQQFLPQNNIRYEIPKYISVQNTRNQPTNNGYNSYRPEISQVGQNFNWISRNQAMESSNCRINGIGGMKAGGNNISSNLSVSLVGRTNVDHSLGQSMVGFNNSMYMKVGEKLTPSSSTRNLKEQSSLNTTQNFQNPKPVSYHATPQANKQTNHSETVNSSSAYYYTQPNMKKEVTINGQTPSTPASISQFDVNKGSISSSKVKEYNAFSNDNIFSYFDGIKKQLKEKENNMFCERKQEYQIENNGKKFDRNRMSKDKRSDIFINEDATKNQFLRDARNPRPSLQVTKQQWRISQKPLINDISNLNTSYEKQSSRAQSSLISNSQIEIFQKKNEQLFAKIYLLEQQLSSFKNAKRQWQGIQQKYKTEANKKNVEVLDLKVQIFELNDTIKKSKEAQQSYKEANEKLKEEKNLLSNKITQLRVEHDKVEKELRSRFDVELSKYEKDKQMQKENQFKSLLQIKMCLDRYIQVNMELQKKLEKQQEKTIDLNCKLQQSQASMKRIVQDHSQIVEKLKIQINAIKSQNSSLAKEIANKIAHIEQIRIQLDIKRAALEKCQKNLKKQTQLSSETVKNLYANIEKQKKKHEQQFKYKIEVRGEEIKNKESHWLQEMTKLNEKHQYDIKLINDQYLRQEKQLKQQIQKLITQRTLVEQRMLKQEYELQNVKLQENKLIQQLKQLEKIEKQKATLSQQFIRNKQTIKKLNDENLVLKNEINFLKQDQTRYIGIEQQLIRYKQESIKKQQQIIKHFEDVLKSKQCMIAEQNRKVAQENFNMGQEKYKVDQQIRNLNYKISELNGYKEQKEQLVVEAEKLKKQIATLYQQNKQLNQKLVDQKIIQSNREQNQKMLHQIETLIHQLNQIRQLHKNQITTLTDQYHQSIENLQSQINCQHDEIQYIEQIRDQLKEQNQQLIETNEKLKFDYQMIINQNQRMVNTYNEAMERNSKINLTLISGEFNRFFQTQMRMLMDYFNERIQVQSTKLRGIGEKIKNYQQKMNTLKPQFMVSNGKQEANDEELNELLEFFQEKCKSLDSILSEQSENPHCGQSKSKLNGIQHHNNSNGVKQHEKANKLISDYINKLQDLGKKNKKLQLDLKNQKKEKDLLLKENQKFKIDYDRMFTKITQMEQNMYTIEHVIQDRNRVIGSTSFKLKSTEEQLAKQQQLTTLYTETLLTLMLNKLNQKYQQSEDI